MISKAEAQKSALEFLHSHTTGVVATVNAAGQPESATVYYAVGEHFATYFITSQASRKHHNLLQNHHASFVVGFGPEYTSVQIEGLATLMEGPELETGAALMAEMQQRVKLAQWPMSSVHSFQEAGLALYKITPTRVRFLNINSSDQPTSIADYIYQLLP